MKRIIEDLKEKLNINSVFSKNHINMKNFPTEFPLANIEGLPNEVFDLNKSLYIENVKKNIKNFESDSILLIEGGKEISRNDTDTQVYHFYQDPNFYFFTGLNEPNFYLTLDFKSEAITLFMQMPDEKTNIYTRVPSLEEIKERYGIECLALSTLYEELSKRNPKIIFRLKGENADSGLKIHTTTFNPPEEFKSLRDLLDDEPLIYELLADTRTRKTEYEKNIISYCISKAIGAHLEVMKFTVPNKIERDVENVFVNYLRKNGYHREMSYECIVASGTNSSILHYDRNSDVLKDGGLILYDMGFRLGGYCSDITSTIPINGKYSDKQKSIYNIVLNANRTVMRNVKEGSFWPTMHLLAEKVIIMGLKELGILSNKYSTQEMLEKRVGYYFMPHGLGHFIGLDCHDVGGYLSFTPKRSNLPGLSNLRTARYLEKGNVISIEPGCYFITSLLEQVFKDKNISKYFNEDFIRKEYYDFGGVRIEDMVYITSKGCENLSKDLPRTTDEIESIMKNKM